MNSTALEILCDPRPSDHIVYPYRGDHQVTEAVCLFASAGLRKDEAVLLVVTNDHSELIKQCLHYRGFDVAELEKSGQLAFVNAEELMATFIFDGIIDEHRFKTNIGSAIQRAKTCSGRNRAVRVFGEMVDLIWISNPEGTLRLEELWNEVINLYSVPLLCAYSLAGTKPDSLPTSLLNCHSHTM